MSHNLDVIYIVDTSNLGHLLFCLHIVTMKSVRESPINNTEQFSCQQGVQNKTDLYK